MRILVVHAWLRGNLGDVMQLSVLLSALRELRPRSLDLAGYPARPAEAARELVALADRFVAEPFVWYWKFAPEAVSDSVLVPWWRKRRRALFSTYDAIVCAPGPYLAQYDARAPSALCDIATARDAGLTVVLASHSIGPLRSEDLSAVRRASVCVAREPATHDYLLARGIPSTLAADLAFLYPFHSVPAARAAVPRPPYRLVFLRSNNLRERALRLEGGALFEADRLIVEASPNPLVLATSDYGRDRRFLASAARRLGVEWAGCRTMAELVQLVGGSSGVVSDRYHPAICAASLGKPAHVLPNREPHKMHGLRNLLADRTLEDLQALARAGLNTVVGALRTAA